MEYADPLEKFEEELRGYFSPETIASIEGTVEAFHKGEPFLFSMFWKHKPRSDGENKLRFGVVSGHADPGGGEINLGFEFGHYGKQEDRVIAGSECRLVISRNPQNEAVVDIFVPPRIEVMNKEAEAIVTTSFVTAKAVYPGLEMIKVRLNPYLQTTAFYETEAGETEKVFVWEPLRPGELDDFGERRTKAYEVIGAEAGVAYAGGETNYNLLTFDGALRDRFEPAKESDFVWVPKEDCSLKEVQPGRVFVGKL